MYVASIHLTAVMLISSGTPRHSSDAVVFLYFVHHPLNNIEGPGTTARFSACSDYHKVLKREKNEHVVKAR